MVEKVLNQEQIDAMVRAARGGRGGEPRQRQKSVSTWDVRQAGQIGRGQMRAINTLHEGFARNLTHSLGAYLRVAFTAALVSAEHLTYGEFLQRIPEVTYLASCHLAPADATALLQLDLPVAFPLIDVLLGGEGKGAPPGREITEIEEQILETVVRIICRELQVAWQTLGLEFQFEQRQRPDQVQHLMPSEEKTLSLSFEITVAESRGTLNLVVPAVVSNALLRKLSAGWAPSRPRVRSDAEPRLRARLMDSPFQVELGLSSIYVRLNELVGLAPGQLLLLRRRPDQQAALMVGDQKMFTAAVARRGGRRVAQLLERCPLQRQEREPGK
ncbi:MAG TPA: FliM/FliN family flagellar motor switch protein [Terriglobales bacterium]|nr:FliM/FliN family flagellar motor switch protein [Terriglobales bacterium]